MKLYWSPRSPFVRKVLIVAHEVGVIDDIVRVPTVIISTQPNDDLLPLNPLAQIPTLVTDEGMAVYDSTAICYYLDAVRGGGALHPSDPMPRLAMQRRHALGDGLSTLLLNWLSERSRQQADQSAMRIAAANKKLPYIFRALETEAAAMATQPFDVGHAAVAAALGYLDFRFGRDWSWRDRFPQLARWWSVTGERPSVSLTAYYDELAAGTAGNRKQEGRT